MHDRLARVDRNVRHACSRIVRYCADRDEQQASVARGERTVIDLGAVLPAKPN